MGLYFTGATSVVRLCTPERVVGNPKGLQGLEVVASAADFIGGAGCIMKFTSISWNLFSLENLI